jgi:hypothetical protein
MDHPQIIPAAAWEYQEFPADEGDDEWHWDAYESSPDDPLACGEWITCNDGDGLPTRADAQASAEAWAAELSIRDGSGSCPARRRDMIDFNRAFNFVISVTPKGTTFLAEQDGEATIVAEGNYAFGIVAVEKVTTFAATTPRQRRRFP